MIAADYSLTRQVLDGSALAGALNPLAPIELESLFANAGLHHIEAGSIVEPAAIVCDWGRVGRESLVGAGACVKQRSSFPPRSVLDGFPAQVVGSLDAPPERPSWALTREALETLVRL